ncbi:MAG: hypothetical protein WC343_13150, partial [Bacilli bacterium]
MKNNTLKSATVGDTIATIEKVRQLVNSITTFPGFGTSHVTVAYGDHNHNGIYLVIGDTSTKIVTKKYLSDLSYFRNSDSSHYASKSYSNYVWSKDSSHYASKSYANYVWSKDSVNYISKSQARHDIDDSIENRTLKKVDTTNLKVASNYWALTNLLTLVTYQDDTTIHKDITNKYLTDQGIKRVYARNGLVINGDSIELSATGNDLTKNVEISGIGKSIAIASNNYGGFNHNGFYTDDTTKTGIYNGNSEVELTDTTIRFSAIKAGSFSTTVKMDSTLHYEGAPDSTQNTDLSFITKNVMKREINAVKSGTVTKSDSAKYVKNYHPTDTLINVKKLTQIGFFADTNANIQNYIKYNGSSQNYIVTNGSTQNDIVDNFVYQNRVSENKAGAIQNNIETNYGIQNYCVNATNTALALKSTNTIGDSILITGRNTFEVWKNGVRVAIIDSIGNIVNSGKTVSSDTIRSNTAINAPKIYKGSLDSTVVTEVAVQKMINAG